MAAVPTFRARSTVTPVSGVATVSGAAIGTASAGRIVVVAFSWISNSHPMTSCTIGGVSATNLIALFHNAAFDKVGEIWAAVVPTGTTADIVGNFPSDDEVSVAHWTVEGGKLPVSDTDGATGTGATLSISALTIPTNGCGILSYFNQTQATAVAWTNATEDFDVDAGTPNRHSGASTTTAGTPTITADGATNDQVLIGVAFAAEITTPRKMQQYRRRRV